MTNQEWISMLRVIPEEDQNALVLVLQNGCEISVDTLFHFQTNFLILRGRVGGTIDEGRAFFVPYDQMLYFRIERITNLSDLRQLMTAPGLAAAVVPETSLLAVPVPPPPAPAAPEPPGVTDATANRNALLDRIRAARTTQVSSNRHATR
jgi:hypothetical protein